VVKETQRCRHSGSPYPRCVSIPSRGSGKGDMKVAHWITEENVSIPSRGSGKGDPKTGSCEQIPDMNVSIPSRGSGKGDCIFDRWTAAH
jgi:hypothetical protein